MINKEKGGYTEARKCTRQLVYMYSRKCNAFKISFTRTISSDKLAYRKNIRRWEDCRKNGK